MRENEILVEYQPPHGVSVCDHAGLVINNFTPSKILHFEPSLDALSLRSNVTSSIKILSLRQVRAHRARRAAPRTRARTKGLDRREDARVPRERVIDNLLVRIHYIIVMIKWTGLAPWEFDPYIYLPRYKGAGPPPHIILTCLDTLVASLRRRGAGTHPTPHTLHPAPYTLYPTPYTLHPTLYRERAAHGGGVGGRSPGALSDMRGRRC